jgi:hypothetical protein
MKVNFSEIENKSGHNEWNGRDFLRGLFLAVAVGILTLFSGVDDVRQLLTSGVWIDALNAAWKPFVAYLLINIKK